MQTNLSEAIVELLKCGVFSADRDMRILTWNRFMWSHTGRSAEAVIGMDLLEAFPESPQQWLRKKIEGVFVLGTPAYSSIDAGGGTSRAVEPEYARWLYQDAHPACRGYGPAGRRSAPSLKADCTR